MSCIKVGKKYMTNNGRYNKIPYKNNSNKLTPEMMDEVCSLYENGWKVTWIGNKFKVDHSSIVYYVKKYDLKKKRDVSLTEAIDIRKKYGYHLRFNRFFKNPKEMTHTIHKTYAERTHDAAQKKLTSLHDTECSHQFWIKRCSTCKAILESDSRINKMPSCIQKDIYNHFDRIVCSYANAKQLIKLNINQNGSLLFWVYTIDSKVLQLKSKTNLPDKRDTNTIVVAAFTTQELCKIILNTLNILDNTFLIELATISYKPNELANLLVKIINQKTIA